MMNVRTLSYLGGVDLTIVLKGCSITASRKTERPNQIGRKPRRGA